LSCSDQEESIQSLNVIKRGGCVQFSTCYLGIPELSRGNRVGTCRRIGVSAYRRVGVCGVWCVACVACVAWTVSPRCFTYFHLRAFYIDGQRRSRGSATLPRHTRRHAHAPTRRPADTPIRRYDSLELPHRTWHLCVL
jgi:hypothetical protein